MRPIRNRDAPQLSRKVSARSRIIAFLEDWKPQPGRVLALALLLPVLVLTGCGLFGGGGGDDPIDPPVRPRPANPAWLMTSQIDAFDARLTRRDDAIEQALTAQDPDPSQPTAVLLRQSRQDLLAKRWQVVQLAATHYGTTHRQAFYGSRAYWHTQSSRGLSFALDEKGDLDVPIYIDGRGNVRVAGDANADIEVSGSAIVHILGDLNAKLELTGVCEVVIAGSLGPKASIVCDGQLELFVAGDSAGTIQTTRSATCIIDGNATGLIRCGSPATRLTVTGDLSAVITPPNDEGAVLSLRVDGFAPTSTMRELGVSGFTRVNATLGRSDSPPGLYPQGQDATRPVARWVVLGQGEPSE